MSDDNFSDFLDGVKPLAKPDTITTQHRQLAREQALARQKAAAQDQVSEQSELSDEQEIELVDPMDMLSFQRPGVQHGVFRKLRLGHYETYLKLDLHRHTVQEAQRAVLNHFKRCEEQQLRSTIIIHGLGLKGKPPAMLKSCINTWLRQLPQVMAFHSCQKADGGLGAVYVLLAKSAEAKQLNRERFQKRTR